MRHTPPESLVELLGRLGLATADDFRAAAGRARRLARGLPLFESVWIDALAQAGVLTAFQAAETNARRGERLRVGPYVLDRPQGSLQYAETYAAHEVETGERVLLACQDIGSKPPQESAEIRARLEKLVVDSAPLVSSSGHLLPVVAADVETSRAWAVCRAENGLTDGARSAIEWIIHNGRFTSPAVLEIAREITTALAELQNAGLSHGDIRAETLLLTVSGRALLPCPGLRAAFRPTESHATAELPPEAYDGLAPERSTQAAAANLSSDIFACGCLYWHLLTARPALPGGNGLAKMRSARTLDIPSIQPLAPDTPQELAAAIEACVARDPAARPQSLDQLSEILGPRTRGGRHLLARSLGNVRRVSKYQSRTISAVPLRQTAGKLVGVAAVLALIAAAAWLALPGEPSPEIAKQTSGRAKLPLSRESRPAQKELHPPGPEASLFQQAAERLPAKLLLDGNAPLDAASLKLSPGQTVSAKGPGRISLLVSGGGLLVDVDNVRFENIDFVYEHAPGEKPTDQPATETPTLIDLRAPSIKFHGCTFSTEQNSNESPPTAIRWTHPLDRSSAQLSLPSGSIRLENCVFATVATAIDCRTAAAVSIQAVNVLHLGKGPLVRLDHVPRSDEPLSLSLSRTTLRGSGPLLQCPCDRTDTKPARLTIEAVASVLMPGGENGLLTFVGRSSPKTLLDQIEWTGQGSLVAHKTPIAQWLRGLRGPDSTPQTLDDAAVAIAGLVRGKAQFAAAANTGIAASQVTQWQAPLQSPEPPGVDVGLLPKKAP
ncbi:MAG: protein kinase [Planctomycetota bacterium]|nr:protein kinase [Planctomycetota bacterium]